MQPLHVDLAQYSPRARWFMLVAWLLVLVKCVLVWWAMLHWQIPFHPLWIVAPTLLFAALASLIWATHHR